MTKKRTMILVALAVVTALVLTTLVASAVSTEIDMTIADNSVAYNDAIFTQGPLDVNSAGTGVIDPFLSVGGGGNQAITKGYNTVDASAEFDTITGGDRTRPLLLSGVPEVEIGGIFYREFKLDINKARGGNSYLALNQLKLFLTGDPAITGYDYAGATEFGANATKVWDLGDAVILMDYALESGSGASDVSFFVKSSLFATAEDCSYGSPDCTTYLVMWNEYGNFANSSTYPGRTWENNDGFEEWGIVLRPVVDADKTAEGTYEIRHDWDVIKSVQPLSQSAFAGDPVGWEWTVDIVESTSSGAFAAEGTISIFNPTGCGDATCPIPENVPAQILSVADVIDQAGLTTNATVTCPVSFPYTLGGGATLVCSYTAATPNADPGTNTATITVAVPAQIGGGTDTYEAHAALGFTGSHVNDSATVSDTEIGLSDEPVNGGDQFTGPGGDACSTDLADYGEDNSYIAEVSNTAYLTDEEGNVYDSTATTAYTCYIWDVTKTADGSYNDRYDWDITKTVDPESQSGFPGDTLEWTWSITWESFFVEEINHAVEGIITVDNPAPLELTVDVTDYLTGPLAATVTCNDGDGGSDLTIAANSSGTCSYTAAPGSQVAQNTATASRNGVDVSYTVDVNWAAGPDVGLDATISDTNHADIPVDSPQPFEYSDSIDCSTDAGDYGPDGTYSGSADNTATIIWTGGEDSSSAHTDYTCYIWDVTKTADGSYNNRYDWDITKTVDPESQSGFPGDTLEWTWTITWNSFFVEEINHAVSGVITVDNPAPLELTVDVSDYLTGNFAASVTCNDGDGGSDLTIAANSSGTCSYTAAPGSQVAQNTATASRNGVDVSYTVDVNWAAGPDVGLDATISDTNHADIPVDSPQPFEYSDSIDCSTDAGAYGPDGTYSGSADNTATITWTGGEDSSSAHTDWTCKAGFVDLLKLTNGIVNPDKDWQFALYLGPDGFGGTQVGSSSTLGDADGILEFGNPALRPDTTYTICELGVPAGWTSFWQVDVDGDGTLDATVIPYNPNGDDDPPEDLGNRCVDFGAGTTMPVAVGTTIRFQVDNSFPGGAPRTPGYWKNWNRCTGGGQQFTADANGGYAEGYWLLEDVLDPNIGGGIVWDDILDDELVFAIEDCADAVNILDKRTLNGRKVASDPLHNLATHLLAAQLNFGAGACTTQEVLDAALAAETLLDTYNFDGNSHTMPRRSDDAAVANSLANYLDQYNNGAFCGNGN